MLEEQERKKFIEWLERIASDNDTIAAQVKKLGHSVVVQALELEAHACRVVLKRLRETETMSVRGGPPQ